MASIIIEHGRSLLGITLLGVAMASAAGPDAAPPGTLAPPGPPHVPALGDLAEALAAPSDAIAVRAVYAACRLPPAEARDVAARAAETAPALARLVRDCALPRAEAIAELEAMVDQDDPLVAIAVLELHRLGAQDSRALADLAARQPGLAGWLARYSASTR